MANADTPDAILLETVEAWVKAGYNATQAASNLGVARTTFQSRLSTAQRRQIVGSNPGQSWTSADAWTYPPFAEEEIQSGSMIVFSDGHKWPGPPTLAHVALLRAIKMVKPRIIVANGDMFDGATISRHGATGFSWRPKVREELQAVKERMHEIRLAAGPGVKAHFTMGNHDQRFEKHLADIANDFEGMDGFRFFHHFPEWNVEWALWVNKGSDHPVMVKHRHAGGVHAGYNNAMKGGVTIVTGHTHLLEVKPYGDYRGRRWGVQTGSLSDMRGPQFEYTEQGPSSACSGFAVFTWVDGLLSPPELCEVFDDRAWFRGKIIAED